MNRVVKTMVTETAHRLVDYDGNCQHIHGHSYNWEVAVSALQLDKRGMVLDFKDLKELMKRHIFKYDHALILSSEDPLANMDIHIEDILVSPLGNPPRLYVMDFNPTAENLAAHVFSKIQFDLVGTGLTVDYVKVWETANSHACQY